MTSNALLAIFTKSTNLTSLKHTEIYFIIQPYSSMLLLKWGKKKLKLSLIQKIKLPQNNTKLEIIRLMWVFFNKRISTENFYFTYFKDSPFFSRKDVISLHNDISSCVITRYVYYIPRQFWGGCSVGVAAGSLFCCWVSCCEVGYIKIKLSIMCQYPKICNIDLTGFVCLYFA